MPMVGGEDRRARQHFHCNCFTLLSNLTCICLLQVEALCTESDLATSPMTAGTCICAAAGWRTVTVAMHTCRHLS